MCISMPEAAPEVIFAQNFWRVYVHMHTYSPTIALIYTLYTVFAYVKALVVCCLCLRAAFGQTLHSGPSELLEEPFEVYEYMYATS